MAAPLSVGVGAGPGAKKCPRGRVGGGDVGTSDGGDVGDRGLSADGVGDGVVLVPEDGDDAGGEVGDASEGPGDGPGGLPGVGVGGPDGSGGGIGGPPVEDGPCVWRRLRRSPRNKRSSPICCCCCEFDFRAGAEASAMSLMKKQKQARATATTTNERRPPEVAIVGAGSVFVYLRSTIF